jgi:nucleotide-binding universal stress UspA family protein
MKTILVPTDFSGISVNALDYAAQLAKRLEAKLVLFHTFYVPNLTTEVPAFMPITGDIEEGLMETLKEHKQRLERDHGTGLEIDFTVRAGFAVEEIRLYAEEIHADLIVMGMQGAGYFSEKLVGSTTTSLVGKVQCPILAIDEKVTFSEIRQIVLACDYSETQELRKTLAPLKELTKLFDAHISVLHVVPGSRELLNPDGAPGAIQLSHVLEDLDHTFHSVRHEDIVEGINLFVRDKQIDLIAMIPHKHSLFEQLFRASNTKKMIFHTHIPVMTLPAVK